MTFQVFGLIQTILRQSAQCLRELSAKMCLSGDEAGSIGELQPVLQLLNSVPDFIGQGGLIRWTTLHPLILLFQVFCHS